MKVKNEINPVMHSAVVWSISKNLAKGISGPIPICMIFLITSLLFGLKTL